MSPADRDGTAARGARGGGGAQGAAPTPAVRDAAAAARAAARAGGGSEARGAASSAGRSAPPAPDTRTRLLEGTLRTLDEQGIAKVSARTVAAAAGVNQALVFYHFGSMDELLAAACRHGAEERVARYRERLAGVTSFSGLLAIGREIHEAERAAGHVALIGQMLAGAQTHARLGPATAAGLDLWITEIEKVLRRVLAATPFGAFTDPEGLARAIAASFVGLELYEGADREGAARALDALEGLADLAAAVDGLGPVAQRAVRAHLRRTLARPVRSSRSAE